ncbi:MAG TPA: ABC transporter ATP-binding protein [Candidatus Sulfomarinibacteraceae bacterium]|nr:ABC transporter ATP-binding protein [Candidatus Sulfomarinibacteraceae bacterium]
MADPLLQVRDLEVRYYTREGVLTAIRGASFDIRRREIVGVVGESGCGKSTVASAVMGLLPPNGEISRGQIVLDGQDLTRLRANELHRRRGEDMAMIFQDAMTSLNPVFSIEQQMLDAQLAHRPRGPRLTKKKLRARAVAMLERVGIPDAAARIKEFPHQFSGGMRQRIMIAMALLSSPSLLVADEPTSALDVTLEAQILELVTRLRDELDTAILYITHDLGVVAQVCDRVIVMYAGNVVETGDVLSLFDRPKHPYTQALLRSHPSHRRRERRLRTIPGLVPSLRDMPAGCKFAPRCDLARDICHEEEPALWPAGRQTVLCHAYAPEWDGPPVHSLLETPAVPGTPPPASAAEDGGRQNGGRRDWSGGELIIQTRDLHKEFQDRVGLLGQLLGQRAGSVKAVAGVDLDIRRGETLGLVGESGSGKTTLARTILRLLEPTRGAIVVGDRDISSLPEGELRPLRSQMQMIFQDPLSSLSPRMKASSLLLEPFRIHGRPVDAKEKVHELLAMVGLSAEQADKYPHQLSGGQARRLGIARALALEPDILLADEPTAGLDVSVAAGILNLLKDLRERLNLTYLVISHNLNVIGFISDRVAVMYLGRVVELARTEALFARPRHPYTEALLSAIPVPDPRRKEAAERIILSGEIPSPRNPPAGCPFHPRCPYAEARCEQERPLLQPHKAADDGSTHWTACHFPEKVQRGAA